MKALLASFCFALAAGQSQSDPELPFAAIIERSNQSLEAARGELEETRARIAVEQGPLFARLERVQSEVAVLRRESAQLDAETAAMKREVETLSSAVEGIGLQQQSIENRLLHLRRRFEETLHVVERPSYRADFLALEQVKTDTIEGRIERINTLFALAHASLERLERQTGGRRYPAQALADGVMASGTALQFGPYAFFAPDAGEGGLIVAGEDLRARLRRHSPETGQAITVGMRGEETDLPFDPLLDQAFLNADAEVSLWEHLKSGGVWIIPIAFFGIVSLLIALVKAIQIRAIRSPETSQIAALVAAVRQGDFESRLEAITPHARPIFAEGFADRNAPERARSAAMYQALLDFRDRIESRLSLLGLTAAVAPLLGLLGTVTGMIKTFQLISVHGAGDARTLSGGISEALVTTEFGLVVAIPALLVHAWLQRRVKRLSIQTTALAERFNQTLPEKGVEP